VPLVVSGTETKAQGCAENLIAVEVPAGSTMTLRANFDYAATSIAHFTINGCPAARDVSDRSVLLAYPGPPRRNWFECEFLMTAKEKLRV
jgi:hypothetical protein